MCIQKRVCVCQSIYLLLNIIVACDYVDQKLTENVAERKKKYSQSIFYICTTFLFLEIVHYCAVKSYLLETRKARLESNYHMCMTFGMLNFPIEQVINYINVKLT